MRRGRRQPRAVLRRSLEVRGAGLPSPPRRSPRGAYALKGGTVPPAARSAQGDAGVRCSRPLGGAQLRVSTTPSAGAAYGSSRDRRRGHGLTAGMAPFPTHGRARKRAQHTGLADRGRLLLFWGERGRGGLPARWQNSPDALPAPSSRPPRAAATDSGHLRPRTLPAQAANRTPSSRARRSLNVKVVDCPVWWNRGTTSHGVEWCHRRSSVHTTTRGTWRCSAFRPRRRQFALPYV